ncbi:permease [Sorangium cellulosum]|uniref:Permease n=1 Tax=Sorangium cellulosum TaxID=56 RepID=A0A4V0NEV4_SORCE|nr:type 1 glutamine amidotransferase domain-containing protein [Sorangium cellulosum]AUX27482.1 permease [Sorangium cellulosum]
MTGRKRLAGKRIAALAADGFEQLELTVPMKALRAEGAEVEVVSLRRGKIRGMNLHEPGKRAHVDRTLDEADPAVYDALLLPGGFISPDLLRQSEEARRFVRAFDDQRKPIATLCHGPWLLVSAELVSGRQLASWPGIRDDIVHAGGVWRDEETVRDGNWLSSRGPQDLPAFVRAMIDLFAEAHPIHAAASPLAVQSAPQRTSPPLVALGAAAFLPSPSGARRVLRGAAALAVGGLAVLALRRVVVA